MTSPRHIHLHQNHNRWSLPWLDLPFPWRIVDLVDELPSKDGMEIYLAAGFRGRRSIPCPRAPHFIAAKLMLKIW
ncbi:hypothetical protein MUK42_34187 [Musa troglodytarum]|uniref:Uncharacterized protein n=1 Tax=Musa troglodytarum TaxID=320322 RepID=A0A9E7K3U9_9LILI|nr:hypothetical protein MUK42_34187 [Musa troglodytarum]